MAQGELYFPNATRPHWGGPLSDQDQHLELYTGIVDSEFLYTQIFSSMSSQRTTEQRSNTIRLDRLNKSKVLGRKAGGAINSQRVTSDKLNIIVEVMLYIRNPIDDIDSWTAPDFLVEMGRNNGSEFGLTYDEAHIITLQKARDFVPPAAVADTFHEGISVDVTLKATIANVSDLEANASALVVAHGKVVEALIKRRVPLGDVVTIVTPEVFTELVNHPKLINKDYVADNGDFANRRVVRVNGIDIVECTAFPQEVTGVGLHHPLSTTANGNAFDVTAEDLKGEMIVFSKSLSLVTVTAKEFHSKFWEDHAEMCHVLDCRAMYTVDTRRPDTIGVVLVTRTDTP